MNEIANTVVKFFDKADELRHARTDDPLWQESVVMHWYDKVAGIGGFHRIGHEPNHDGGVAVLWSMLFDKSGWRYRRDLLLPLTPADEPSNGFSAGPQLSFTCDPVPTWRIEDEDLSLRLECRDFCPLLDASAGVASELSHGHFETAGVVTGRLRHKNRNITINGFGWRDHSWGPRDWNGFVLNHRWIAGTFGPELSYFALTIQGANGDFFPIGFIMQNETVRVTRDFDLVMYMEVDGLTHRGGELVFQFPDSANIPIRFTALDGALFRRGALAVVDTICTTEWSGRTGFCNAEMSTNPRLGSAPIKIAVNANLENGFSTRPPRQIGG